VLNLSHVSETRPSSNIFVERISA